MKLHANAALTVEQRREVKRLHEVEKVSIRRLAARYRVSTTTIGRWIKRDEPHDRSGTPRPQQRVVTDEYRAAVLEYRQAHPHHGPIRIATALKGQFPQAHRGTVQQILTTARISQRQTQKRPPWKIPVGRHRVQMDIQQLPAIEGESGYEYKISLIHLNTRVKYSEIHPECTSQTVAEVFERALDQLPPFLLSGRTMP
jgi:transposase